MKNNRDENMNNFILSHKIFIGFILLQLLILIFLFFRFFGAPLEIQFNAENLDIADEKVVVNEDNSIYITGKNDEEPFGRWIAGTEQFDLRGGMYEVAVNYRSLLYDTDEVANYENVTGMIEAVREEKADNFYFNNLTFQDGDTYRTTRIWVRDDSGEKNLQMKINFYGTGELTVNSIVIKELISWRFMRFLGWLIAFIVIDAIVFYCFIYENAKNKLTIVVLVFTIFFANLPMFTDLLFFGHAHDLNFHITRILTLAQSLSAGNIIEPIQTEMLNGYGYATPLFYGQLFLYLPAILYNLAVPMQICYQIYAIIVNIVTCLIAYYSFKDIAKDDKIAVTGAVAYTLSIYRITNQMIRAAVGEYTAMAFFPLIACGLIRVYTKKEDRIKLKDYLPIVIGLSGIIQSHLLSCELTAVFILLICIVFLRKTFSPKRFIALLKAAVFTLFINLGFLFPFIDSMGMDIKIKSIPINNMQKHGAYLLQVLSPFQVSYGGSIRGMRDEMSLSLGFAFVLGFSIFLICCVMYREWKIKKYGFFNVGVTSAIFTVVCIVMTLKFFPWNSIEGFHESIGRMFCIIQFPWRYLGPATIFATITTIIGLAIIKETKGAKIVYFLCIVLGLIAVITNGYYMAIYTNGMDAISVFGDADVIIEIGTKEYLLNDTPQELFYQRKVLFDQNFVTISDYQYKNGVTTFSCINTANKEMPIEIPLLNYDNYHAYDTNTGKEIGIMNGTNNRVSLAVPALFDSEVKVVYKIPVTWKIAYVISIISVLFLVMAVVRTRRKERIS